LIFLSVLLFSFSGGTNAFSGEEGDELYRQGRFAEAEKAYAALDMESPKDLRYRFNRGCAAYQGGSYQAARAAFSSVLEKTDDPEMRFRAAYNLGNTAYRLGDFAGAVEYFTTALTYNSSSEDSRYNLEVARRALAQSQKGEKKTGETRAQSDDKESEDWSGQDESTGAPNKDEEGKAGDRPVSEDRGKSGSDDLENQDIEASAKRHRVQGQMAGALLDKNKAQAFLENVSEKPSDMLRYRLRGKERVAGGLEKDW
jgi:Ca-activated chloride channel family protein